MKNVFLEVINSVNLVNKKMNDNMKSLFSKYIKLLAVILLSTVGVGQAWGENVTWEGAYGNFDSKELLVIFGVIFTQLGISITTLFIDKNNSPCHNFIIFVFGQFAYYIDFQWYTPLVIVCLIIILFLSLIFNEIIEINVCGLSYNTKRNIITRAVQEEYLIGEENDEGSENNENVIGTKNNEIYS